MPAHASPPDLLTLHALRLLGFADGAKAAVRFGLDGDTVGELLMDFEAYGWVTRVEFAGSGGWTLTASGLAENERQLAAELAACGASGQVVRVHAAFLPLNLRFQETMTRWQLRPVRGDPMALNDHTDFRWDDRVLDSLGSAARRLAPLVADLSAVLSRFDGYAERFNAALSRVERGERQWVDAVGVDSCHVVWFQLHEDLLASLGIDRGQEE
ncbi:transcriptional regulator [Pengzhenrongella frigida]|uniref:Transcriptional regulator n=1 Tax=Pengzhenrongella frigida TaxID=1259133 RepID=A0A4Q5MYG7_9MICO|nr:transcriptional regulator [Cellulomonas sp. HLT2-17]RYV49953.1 transcriptional regulator [Cellulomonas sp. HLT2-17]